MGLADLAALHLESHAKSLRDADSSVNLDWFFENPDFKNWDSSSYTEILQLGGKSKVENHRVYVLLLQTLLDRGANVIQASCSSSLGFDQLHAAKPEEQACRVVQLLIGQLIDGDDFRLRYAMEHHPISKITKAKLFPSKSEESMLGQMIRVLFCCLAARPDQQVYLLLDGIDILGPAMGQLVNRLGKLYSNLKDPDDMKTPVVKIFLDTPPRSSARPFKGHDQAGDSISYIEKDKEMKGVTQE